MHVIHATSVAVSREHRRAKTDRLDTAMLKRGFLGWLRGERGHCTVAIVPTMEEEDAKRPHREREGLVHEQTRVVNRMKSALIQFGVRNFNPKLRKARVKLETVRTPEGKSLPPNTIAALRRDMERLMIIKEQSRQSNRPGCSSLNKSRRLLRTGWFICWYGFTGLVGRRFVVHKHHEQVRWVASGNGFFAMITA